MKGKTRPKHRVIIRDTRSAQKQSPLHHSGVIYSSKTGKEVRNQLSQYVKPSHQSTEPASRHIQQNLQQVRSVTHDILIEQVPKVRWNIIANIAIAHSRENSKKSSMKVFMKGRDIPANVVQKNYGSLAALSRHKGSHAEANDKKTSTMFSMCGNSFHCGECNIYFDRNQAREYNQHLDDHVRKSDFGKIMRPTK